MILLHGINDNILIPHLYYLGVYQDEEKNERLKKDKYVLGVGTKPLKTDKIVVHFSL